MTLLLAAAAAWTFRDGRDPINDTYWASARLPTSYATLFVECADDGEGLRLAVGVLAREYVGTEDYRRVEYRFDGSPPESSAWAYARNSSYNSDRRETPALAERLRHARTLVIRLYKFDGATLTYRFDLPDERQALDQTISACR